MVLFVGRDHHQDAIRAASLFLELDCPVNGTFANGDRGDFNFVPIDAGFGECLALPDALEQFFGIAELRQVARAAKIGQLKALDAGQNQLLGVVNLGVRRNELLFVL